jgi:hypothetical protein
MRIGSDVHHGYWVRTDTWGAGLSGERALGYARERGYREAGRRLMPRDGSVRSCTAVFFAGGEATLLTPFRAGSAHVVQLRTIGIENARRPFRERRAETLPDFTREGADERQFSGDSGTWCHHVESHLSPLWLWPKGI